MNTLHDFIQVCNAFQENSCDRETGEFNFEKYRDCVMCITEPELNEKVRYFIDYVGPYVYCSDSNTFYIPTPGTDVYCEACEDIFKAVSDRDHVFTIKVVSGKDSELSDFNQMLDEDTDFSTTLREDNRVHTLEHFEQLLTNGPYAIIPNMDYEESFDLCVRQCNELGLYEQSEKLLNKSYVLE